MSDYISRQEAIDACFDGWNNSAGDCARNIKCLPPADVVPVVRCKNCNHWQTDWNPSIPDRHYCAVMDSMMKADGFCSYGERRGEQDGR